MASFLTFSPSVPGMSVPSPLIGEAAPMLVPGAISAMFAERVMNVPALAANPPAGATHTITGIFASRNVPTMAFVERRSPPGVLSFTTTAAAPLDSAWLIESARYLAMPPSTMPVVGRTTTSGPAPRAPVAKSSQPSAINANEIRGSLRRVRVDTVVTTSTVSIAPWPRTARRWSIRP